VLLLLLRLLRLLWLLLLLLFMLLVLLLLLGLRLLMAWLLLVLHAVLAGVLFVGRWLVQRAERELLHDKGSIMKSDGVLDDMLNLRGSTMTTLPLHDAV
jgi:hypothetical protein